MRVTITGADDATDVDQLFALSAKFPFVEWGILFSTKRFATPRYPSEDWLGDLADALDANDPINLSLHVCGEASRQVRLGKTQLVETLPAIGFQRIQLNGYEAPSSDAFVSMARAVPDLTFILQARAVVGFGDVVEDARRIGNAVVLFDPSGGRGASFQTVPNLIAGHGLAGGIGPDNIHEMLGTARQVGASWIDMESRVRTDDTLDLAKVRAVLEAARDFQEAA